jgi:hypothetical protein
VCACTKCVCITDTVQPFSLTCSVTYVDMSQQTPSTVDSSSSSSRTFRDVYNSYQPPSPPPSPPAMCVFGVDCPVQPGSCAQGYTGRAIAAPCLSGCAQGITTVTCQPSTCCEANAAYPPANGEHRLAVAGGSWTTQGLNVPGGMFTEVRCNVGYVLSGKNLGFQKLGTQANGYSYTFGASGTNRVPTYAAWNWPDDSASNFQGCTSSTSTNRNTQCRFRQAIPGDGGWKLEDRTCSPVSCGSYVPPLYGTVSPSGPLTYGQTVTITCNTGFELMGDDRASATPTCQAVGNFTSGKVCVQKSCGAFSTISRGTAFPALGVLSGQEVMVVCDDGYEVSGDSSILCNRGAYQIKTSPTCQRISCGVLEVVNGISLPSTNISFGDISQILCNAGYGLSTQRAGGSMQPNCTFYGTFSPSWECVECQPGTYSSTEAFECLDCPENSTSTLRSSSLANCTCNAGFSGPNGGPCVACVPGKYKAVTGSVACSACPSNSDSPDGSSSFTECTSNAAVTSASYTTTTTPQPTTSPQQVVCACLHPPM